MKLLKIVRKKVVKLVIEDRIKNLLSEIFGPESQEVDTLVDAYNLIVKTAPTVSSEAKTHLLLLDHSRTKLASLYYMITRVISKKWNSMQSTYDETYVQLVRRGRPSKDAIEAEIRQLNPEYSGIAYQVSQLEEVKELINMYLRCIDSNKTTTLEILRNINRID